MKLSDFDYDLPPELIAQSPPSERRAARMLVYDAERDEIEHRTVADIPEYLVADDLLVVNDTRVRRARLRARRPGGGKAEVLLVERAAVASSRWLALVRPASRLRPGLRLEFFGGAYATAVERERTAEGGVGPGWWIDLVLPRGVDEEEWIEAHGELPLPPYIARPDGSTAQDDDRYQTIYSRVPGAVAAPTAGLHLDAELLSTLETQGVRRAAVTLHVGPGTFRPVEVEDPKQHRMHAEQFVLPEATADAIEATRTRSARVVAVGTTSARTLEASSIGRGRVRAGAGSTDLFLYPGVDIDVVDVLLTNFHLPRSTLLMLVSALAGRDKMLELYRLAIEERYRFFSYGDAMLIIRPRRALP
ncbi:MAG: tRNA preQ1(34) S-adenosylmethionine ribosyltransferase-isomerase QueA [Planctomycetota bacterium]|jgi:S-adenosylmethionine:tRNA ribosyltransferase-isomerase